jgi:hypothetical protein
MSIWGVMPNINEAVNTKAGNKTSVNLNNYNGPSFVESISDVAKAANIHVASGQTAASLAFTRQKEVYDKPFSFEEAEEEMLEDHLTRIQELFEDLSKNK